MPVPSRVVLVTGASSGFGAVTAARFARAGLRVFGTSRSGVGPVPGVEWLALDVDHDASVRRCVDDLLERAGRIDHLINNAGRAMVGACEETSADEARALLDTNLLGVMRVVSAVLPSMRSQGGGSIVNVGSLSGFVGVPFHGVYAATKHALAGYTEALRLEVAGFGVRVALIEPAAHRTAIQMVRPARPLALYDHGRQRVEQIIRRQIDDGDDPARVADAIWAAATAARPPLRIRVGGKAAYAAWARRWLPRGLFERVVRREFEIAPRLPGRQG